MIKRSMINNRIFEKQTSYIGTYKRNLWQLIPFNFPFSVQVRGYIVSSVFALFPDLSFS